MDLIVGGTGRLGRVLARMLLAAGRPVRVMTRVASRGAALAQAGAEIVEGDLLDPSSLARACRGVERVVSSAHGFEAADGAAVDADGNRSLVDAATAAGVRRFVLVSVLGASPESPIDVFRAKHQAEAYLRASALPHSIVRAAAFMEFWAALIGEPILRGAPATLFGRGDNPVNFVSVEDVAEYVRFALDDPRATGQIIDVGGPENLTLEEVASTFERVSGRRARRRHIPVVMMRVLSAGLRPFRPVAARQMTAGALMATADLRFDPRELLALHPVPLTRLEAVARAMATPPAAAA